MASPSDYDYKIIGAHERCGRRFCRSVEFEFGVAAVLGASASECFQASRLHHGKPDSGEMRAGEYMKIAKKSIWLKLMAWKSATRDLLNSWLEDFNV